MRTLIRDAEVVLPEGTHRMNVLLDGNKIASLDAPSSSRASTIVHAGGMYLMAGVIDDQVHFREPGMEHKEDLRSGSRACARGGVTTFLEMPNTNPTTTSVAALEDKLRRASESSMVNYGFYIGATPDNLDELRAATRTPGIKIFIGSSTGDLLVDDQDALERIFAETTLPITAHCEDEATIARNLKRLGRLEDVRQHSLLRDVEAAAVSTKRAIDLAVRHKRRFHVLHVSTAAELELIRGQAPWITAEACTPHLFFTTDDYERLGTRLQCNPSVKSADDRQALWGALRDGTLQVVATDHAPHTLEEKAKPYPESPSGLPSVENSLPLMLNEVYEGRASLNQVSEWMSEAPARVWDILNKGVIKEGYDADLALVDMEKRQVIEDDNQESRCGWSPWAGQALHGWPVRTWVMGREAFVNGALREDCRGEEAQYDHSRGGYWSGESAE